MRNVNAALQDYANKFGRDDEELAYYANDLATHNAKTETGARSLYARLVRAYVKANPSADCCAYGLVRGSGIGCGTTICKLCGTVLC